MDKTELATMAKAFETNIEGLAKLTGYTRPGLYVCGKNIRKSKAALSRDALTIRSENLYQQAIRKAESMRKVRQLWIDEFCGGAEDGKTD